MITAKEYTHAPSKVQAIKMPDNLNDLSHRLYRDYNKYESLYQTRFSKTLELTHCDEMDRVNECKTALNNFKVNTYATAKV